MNWISVSESLPDFDEASADEVVVSYVDTTTGESASICAAFYMGKFYVLAEWSEDGVRASEIAATHWMSLPLLSDNQSHPGE